MDETMGRLWRAVGGVRDGSEEWSIALDVIQRPDEIVVKASVPGINPDGIDVAIEDDILTIRAERKPEFQDNDSVYLVQERPTGSFFRSLRLPENVDANKVRSVYEQGILTITLPKAEEKKRKQIKIQIGSGVKAIETKKEK